MTGLACTPAPFHPFFFFLRFFLKALHRHFLSIRRRTDISGAVKYRVERRLQLNHNSPFPFCGSLLLLVFLFFFSQQREAR